MKIYAANLASASEGSAPWFVSAFNNNGFGLGDWWSSQYEHL